MVPAKMDKLLLPLVMAVAALGTLLLVALGNPYQQTHYYSTVYIKPGSYTNEVKNGETKFDYVIENHEAGEKEYLVRITAGSQAIKQFTIRVGAGAREDFTERFPMVGTDQSLPLKVKVSVSVGAKTYEVHYWLKKRT